MTGTSDGYVTDIDYTFGYYGQLNPLRARLAFLQAGYAPPDTKTACELGFGQGVSLALHAAGSTISWHGTDIMPSHVAFADRLAAASGADCQLAGEHFDTYCQRADLPGFDFIAMHGVWSWVSAKNRSILEAFIARKLNPGGFVYVSYNALPGSGEISLLRELIAGHIGDATEDTGARIKGALAFLGRVFDVNPGIEKDRPGLRRAVEWLMTQDHAYLAHEFFNENWLPMYFREAAAKLTPLGLTFVGSARPLGNVEVLRLPPAQRDLIDSVADPLFRETVRDFLLNRRFRTDFWARGPRRLTADERIAALKAERIVLLRPKGRVGLNLTWVLNSAGLTKPDYAAILRGLKDQQPKTIGELVEHPDLAAIDFEKVLTAVMFLLNSGVVASAQSVQTATLCRAQTDRLNAHLLETGLLDDLLASPVTGGAVQVTPSQRALLKGAPASADETVAVDLQFLHGLMIAWTRRCGLWGAADLSWSAPPCRHGRRLPGGRGRPRPAPAGRCCRRWP